MSLPGRDENERRRPDGTAFVIALVLTALAALIYFGTRAMPEAAGYTVVGPKTVPYIVAACLAGLALWTAVEAWRGDFPEREAQDFPPLVWIVGGLAAQFLLVKTLGFSIATGLLFAAAAKAFGKGPLWFTAAVGIVFSFAVWFVFGIGLQLTLPEGPLELAVRSVVRGG